MSDKEFKVLVVKLLLMIMDRTCACADDMKLGWHNREAVAEAKRLIRKFSPRKK